MRLSTHQDKADCVGTVSPGHMARRLGRHTLLAAALLAVIAGIRATPQTADEDYRVYTDHPRIFLKAQRLRLLRRERERQSMRWEQFDALVRGGAPLREPGFALALYYEVSGDKPSGQRAIAWARTGTDLRQLAIVFDWCQDLLDDNARHELAARILRMANGSAANDTAAVRDRALAAIAVAEQDKTASERILTDLVRHWWRERTAPELTRGERIIAHDELWALEELMHVIRDNLRIDLRDDARDYFMRLPLYEIASYYPAPLQGQENDYYIPASRQGEPDIGHAILSRVADLSLVAYDNNAQESQYVQGWTMQDRFMLRDTLGAPYEFLWGNPYQPGLSYYQLPLAYYDPTSGALFLRSSWDDDAKWFGLVGTGMQLFEGGHMKPAGPNEGPIEIGNRQVVPAEKHLRFATSGDATYIVGLPPRIPYLVEIDDEEMQELTSDPRGTLEFPSPKDRKLQVLLRAEK